MAALKIFRLSFTSVLYFHGSDCLSEKGLVFTFSVGELLALSVGDGVVFSDGDVLADCPDSSLLPLRDLDFFSLTFSTVSPFFPFPELALLIFPCTRPPRPPMFFFSLIPRVLLRLPILLATESVLVLSLSFLCFSFSFSLPFLPLLPLELLQMESLSESIESAKDCTSSPAEAVGDSGWAKGACYGKGIIIRYSKIRFIQKLVQKYPLQIQYRFWQWF